MTRAVIGRFGQDRKGVAAIEAALLLPMLILISGLVLDYGRAFAQRIRLNHAMTAGAHYAIRAGENLTRSTAVDFATRVAAVVTQDANLSARPVIGVLFNSGNDADQAAVFSRPPSRAGEAWRSTGAVAASCGENLTSGRSITITASATLPTSISLSPIIGSTHKLSDRVVVRLE